MQISNLKQTCCACPSQWEFTTDNGHMVYVRYRWACLNVYVSPEPTTNAGDAVDGVHIYGEEIGHPGCGEIEWEEVERRIKDIDVLAIIAEDKQRAKEADEAWNKLTPEEQEERSKKFQAAVLDFFKAYNKHMLGSESIGRKIFQVEPLPQGALATYEKEVNNC